MISTVSITKGIALSGVIVTLINQEIASARQREGSRKRKARMTAGNTNNIITTPSRLVS